MKWSLLAKGNLLCFPMNQLYAEGVGIEGRDNINGTNMQREWGLREGIA